MDRQLRCLACGVCRPASPVSAQIGLGRSSRYGQGDDASCISPYGRALRIQIGIPADLSLS